MTEPTQLHALADGEMDPKEANALREALKADPRAAAEVDAILNLKDLLARNTVAHSEAEVWKNCVRRLDALDKTRKVEGFFARYAWALCGAMFLFILSGRIAMRNVQGDSARAADVSRVFGGSAAPVTPANRMQSKLYETILGEVGRNLDPNEIEIGVPVHGNVGELPAVRVPMRDGEGDLVLTRVSGLLEFQDTAPLPANPDLAAGIADGENCLAWHAGGDTWILSGARSTEALGGIASRLLGAH